MVGYVSTVVVIFQVVIVVIAIWKGVLPSLFRLGIGLSKRKIAVLADVTVGNSLKQLLVDSGLFQEKNIEIISTEDDLGRIERCTSILLHWKSWEAHIKDVLDKKSDECSLIIYSPFKDGRIENEQYELLDKKRNVIVTNFRGRLLNDIINSMITSGYARK